MPRYWVIAPFRAEEPDLWDRVWDFDLEHGVISIGWHELGDVSSCSREKLRSLIEEEYPDSRLNVQTLYLNMIWSFYNEISTGDVVLARKGRKRIAAVGTVEGPAYFEEARNVEATGPDRYHSNYLAVRWHERPRDVDLDRVAFGMQTLYEIEEAQYEAFIEPDADEGFEAAEEGVENTAEFVLEKYLEHFIVANFDLIFDERLRLFQDTAEGLEAQQYATDVGVIDILAVDPEDDALVVIELKKGRESDRVVGQILRYMGWVRDHLASDKQVVRGIVICREADPKLLYALNMVDGIEVKYYKADFKLVDEPST